MSDARAAGQGGCMGRRLAWPALVLVVFAATAVNALNDSQRGGSVTRASNRPTARADLRCCSVRPDHAVPGVLGGGLGYLGELLAGRGAVAMPPAPASASASAKPSRKAPPLAASRPGRFWLGTGGEITLLAMVAMLLAGLGPLTARRRRLLARNGGRHAKSKPAPVTAAGFSGPARLDVPVAPVAREWPDDAEWADDADEAYWDFLAERTPNRPESVSAEREFEPTRTFRVSLGHDWIDAVLAESAAAPFSSGPRNDRSWLAATPHVVWTPLPYDVPRGGVAFVCVGAGDKGCLFLDLAAAPGPIAIHGDLAAARRLAESMAHQLCLAAGADQPCIVTAVGDALPAPLPSRAESIDTLSDLMPAVAPQEADPEIVFCELASDDDAITLVRYARSASRHMIFVVLGSLPDARWSFTVRPREAAAAQQSQITTRSRGWIPRAPV